MTEAIEQPERPGASPDDWRGALGPGALAAAVEQIVESIVITDVEGTIRYVNPAFERATGYSRRETLGRNPRLLKSGEQGAAFYAEMWSTIRSGRVWTGNFRNRRKDGTIFEEAATISPVLNGEGGIAGFVAVKRDVTHEREMERRVRDAQKMQAISQLAAGIAHEINTPIQYLGDNLGFLEDAFGRLSELARGAREVASVPSAERARRLEALERSLETADVGYLLDEVPAALRQSVEGLERVATIVRALGQFAQPAANRILADLNAAIDAAVNMARGEWAPLAELDCALDPDLPRVPCLPDSIKQVFLGLIANAAWAIGQVRRDGDKGRIAIASRRDGEWVEVTVEDNGSGIPWEIRDRVFEPFFTTREVGRGTGQGLSVVHAIVDKHGGTIRFDSEPGKGTRFVVRLPLGKSAGSSGRGVG